MPSLQLVRMILLLLLVWTAKAQKRLFQSEFEALGRQAPPLPDPNHHWIFNGDTLDKSGDADGTPVGGTITYNNDSADGDQALVLANGDFVEITSIDLKQEINGYYSIAMWFKATTTLDGVRYLYEEGGRRSGVGIRINQNHVESLCYSFDQQGDEKVARALTSIQANRWHHVLALFDGFQQKLHVFVDGGKKGTIDTRFSFIPSHTNPTSIGGLGSHGATTTFEELVDAVSIWRAVPLADDDVQDLFKRNQPFQLPPPPLFYWSLDDGDLLDDSSDL